MRKIINLYIISALFFLNASFQTSSENWGNWSYIESAYPGIEVRVARGDFNEYANKYHWDIQFRNRYSKSVQFNYGYTATNERGQCNPDHRKHIEPGETSDITAGLINDVYMVHFCMGNLKFEE
jgi:hypothetical protein